MPLSGYQPMAAFSINENGESKVYFFEFNYETQISILKEIDMVNKTVSDEICVFNIPVLGAAAPYSITSTNSVCENVLNTNNGNYNAPFIRVNNPASGNIEVSANSHHDISKVTLFDLSGREIKNYNNIQNMDIHNTPPGIYILEFNLADGQRHTQKLIIK